MPEVGVWECGSTHRPRVPREEKPLFAEYREALEYIVIPVSGSVQEREEAGMVCWDVYDELPAITYALANFQPRSSKYGSGRAELDFQRACDLYQCYSALALVIERLQADWSIRNADEYVASTAGAQPDVEMQMVFADLADTWQRETAVLSSITMKSMHPAYQRIIGMGPKAVPLIFRRMETRPGHWFWALAAITGEDPVDPQDAGDIPKMTNAWLELGRRRGWL